MKKVTISSTFILRSLCIIVLFCSFASGVAFYLFRIDFLKLLPKTSFCLFHFLTGLDCPFCGTTRAFLALGQLKFAEALSFNPFSVILVAIMAIYLYLRRIPLWLQHKAWAYLFAFSVIINWAIRLKIINFFQR